MNQTEETKKETSVPVYITLSLPSGQAGIELKEALRDIAKSNQRSVSNQCVCILQEAIDKMSSQEIKQ